jgi:hypothetical protein
MHGLSDRFWNLTGWVLFILSALAFLIASWGDPWGMAGSLFFLIACLVFLVPYFRSDKAERPSRS